MAFRYFVGQSQEWLEARLREVNEELASDKTVIGWSEGGSSASKLKGNSSPMQRRNMLLHDLNILDSETYPLDQIAPRTSVGVFVDNA